MAKKREIDHVAAFERALADARASFQIDPSETYEQAVARARTHVEALETAFPRMFAALKGQRDGIARSAGIAKSAKAPTLLDQLCSRLAKKFPREIAAFSKGTPLTSARLTEMVAAVAPGTRVNMDSLRRRLSRSCRHGLKRPEARRNAAADAAAMGASSRRARRLDIRNGEIFRAPPSPEPDINELFPGLKLIKRRK
jgi:hypothetical protein